jgi:cell wall-associated NlpC family hydrolase
MIARGCAGLRREPSPQAVQDNELLFGDVFTVFAVWPDGWFHGQSAYDDYVGYVRSSALADPVAPTHRVTALSTPLLEGPAIRAATRELLPLNAQVKVIEPAGDGFVRVAPGGFVWAEHLVPLDRFASDWVATAERFLGAPYVWGGRTHHGIDCSGLVQIALASAGFVAPRDTDQQEAVLGTAITSLARQRGDLVFWNGHVGVMLDATRLLHANAFHMQVEIEPLADAIARIAHVAGPVTTIRRLQK